MRIDSAAPHYPPTFQRSAPGDLDSRLAAGGFSAYSVRVRDNEPALKRAVFWPGLNRNLGGIRLRLSRP